MNTTKEQRAELARLAGRDKPEYAYQSDIAFVMAALPALLADAERLEEVEREHERLLMQIDPPVCRLQLPDGSVPGNAIEGVQMWYAAAKGYLNERDTMRRLLNVAVDALRGIEWSNSDYRWHNDRAREALTTIRAEMEPTCGCGHCDTVTHASDCAVHGSPALPAGPCDCGADVNAKITGTISGLESSNG